MSSSIGRKKRQNAPFSFTAIKVFSAGQNIVSNRDGMHHLPHLFSKFSRISNCSFQIAS